MQLRLLPAGKIETQRREVSRPSLPDLPPQVRNRTKVGIARPQRNHPSVVSWMGPCVPGNFSWCLNEFSHKSRLFAWNSVPLRL